MIHIHRSTIAHDSGNLYFPMSRHYMGSVEFEMGGISRTFRHLTDAEARVMREGRWTMGKNPPITFYVMGVSREAVDTPIHNIEGYCRNEVQSKEPIRFDTNTNDLGHDLGFDIDNHTLITIRPDFIRFVELVLHHQGIDGRELTNNDFRLNDPVWVYDPKHHVLSKQTIKGVKEDDRVVDVLGERGRSKRRANVNSVCRIPQ